MGASTPTLVKLQLTATATSTGSDGGVTTVTAIVDYRPDLLADQRVAVNSVRVVEP